MARTAVLCVVLWGCTDTFALPVFDGSVPPMPDASSVDAPAAGACQDTGCTTDGDVTISSGTLTGCHNYGTLRVQSTVTASDLKACATTIIIEGTLSADGQGEDTATGPGAGEICGSGGGHGGRGGPLGCLGGVTYGDAAMPRTRGSGGGGLGGGRGGGVIELHATSLQLAGVISANGGDSQAGPNGGGAGGSILIVADSISGIGIVRAAGGGAGIGGGGGGGRIAVYGTIAAPGPTFDVLGGHSTIASGDNGTLMRP